MDRTIPLAINSGRCKLFGPQNSAFCLQCYQMTDLKTDFGIDDNNTDLESYPNTNTADFSSPHLDHAWFPNLEFDLCVFVSMLPARVNLDTYITTWFNLPEYHKCKHLLCTYRFVEISKMMSSHYTRSNLSTAGLLVLLCLNHN